MSTFIVPFWIVLSFFLVVLVAVIWLAVLRHQERKHTRNAVVAIQFIGELYFLRCLEKTILSMFREETNPSLLENDPSTIEKRLTQACASWNKDVSLPLAFSLLRFNRGQEVLSKIRDVISTAHRNPEDTDVSLLPDVIVSVSGNTFYRDLWSHASRIIYKEEKVMEPKTNDEAKSTLLNLFSKQKNIIKGAIKA